MKLVSVRSTKTLQTLSFAKFFLLPCAVSLMVSISSCDKSSTLGLNVQPVGDLLNVCYDDTTKLITKTVRETHLRTDQGLITSGAGLIGKYIDPIFGRTESALYTQIRQIYDYTSNSFGSNPVCDSVVLSLAYGNNVASSNSLGKPWYGEGIGKGPLKNQRIDVYEATEAYSLSTGYYSDTTRPFHSNHNLVKGGSFIFNPEISNYVTVDGIVSRPQLRIPLEKELGQTILNNQTTGNLANNTTFQAFFKGLYITATNTNGLGVGEGRITLYDLEFSTLTVYFKNDTSTIHSKLVYTLSGEGRCMYYNRDTVNRATDINVQVADTNRTHNYPRTYVQSMAGLKTLIRMPYLMERIKGGAVSINQAELIVKVDPTTIDYHQDTFEPPYLLLLFGINDSGNSYLIPDLYEHNYSPGYFNANYDATTHEYHLKISRYVQQILDKKINNNGLYLVVSHIRAASTANRVVIGGGDNGSGTNNLQMKLNITYTKLH
jgi:Domain of unknown function (DUF4270)